MERVSPARSCTFGQEPYSNSIQTSLLDNWQYQVGTVHPSSAPQLKVEEVDLAQGFNNNEDDMDCPGHGGSVEQISCSSSSELLYDSSEDDSSVSGTGERSDAGREVAKERAMSIDDAKPDSIDDDDCSNNNNNITFVINHAVDRDPEKYESEPEHNTPTVSAPGSLAPPPQGSFFKLERRASVDNGVFGTPDRILRGQMAVTEGSERHALTAPGTPAEPGTPVARYLSSEELLKLDPEKVLQRVHGLLCSERVTQMTKTYNDIEAVTHLLEEKERDLELAARIGQTLLTKNKELSSRGEYLDEQLTLANEKLNQLKHDLSVKDELLRFYCEDLQDQSPGNSTPSDGAAAKLGKVNVEMLQRKVGTLEEENLSLRLESAQLRSNTESYEEKEKKLVQDCLEQLAELNHQVETFAGELKLKTEESSRQKEEMTSLLAQVAELHKKIRQLTIENMDLAEKLQASQESQKQLARELSIKQDRYDELFEMLEESQDELRAYRSRNAPKATRHLYTSAALAASTGGLDSLASELENSMHKEEIEGAQKSGHRSRKWKVFETARAARKAASKSSRDSSVRLSTSTSSWKDSNSSNSLTPSNVNSDAESFNSDGYHADMDSLYGSSTELGRPGIPGSNDLESALRRLALRRANDMNERDFRDFQEAQQEERDEGMNLFRVGDTPDSMASPASGYSYLSSSNHAAAQFKLPDKLQIVKPLEGSVTLRHWQRLAQPHLGGLFERREGVKVRGERKLDLDGEVYTLSDFEEDDEEVVECPSRRMADSSTIYTFTNSLVSQPSEHGLTPSESSGSLQPLGTSTPTSQAATARKHSTTKSTYTMSLGLAAILQGRENSSTTRSQLRPVASCPVVPADSVATLSGGATAVSLANLDSSANSPSLFGKLISSGYSLLWNKSNSPVSSASSPVSSHESSPADIAKPLRKPTASEILPAEGTTGVLGAIATFRKNGIL